MEVGCHSDSCHGPEDAAQDEIAPKHDTIERSTKNLEAKDEIALFTDV